jgi:hypothetical protein
MALLDGLWSKGDPPGMRTCETLLKKFALVADWEPAVRIIDQMQRYGPAPTEAQQLLAMNACIK